MKDRLTKLFTTFLAVVLLVGMSPAAASTAYAASWNSGAVASFSLGDKLSGLWDRLFGSSNKDDSNPGQTGQTEEKDSTEQVGNQLTANGGTSNSTPKDIALTKTATEKEKDNAGNQIFDISLGVTGDKVNTARPVDVTLVMDVSGSMGDNNKMSDTKKAANDFVDSVLTEGSSARISVVKFSSNASAARFNSSTGSYRDYSTNQGQYAYYSNNAQEVKKAISKLNADGGTNTEAGAVMAKNVTDTRDQNRKKESDSIVIFLTDGEPTFYSNDGVNQAGGIGYRCNNTTFSKATSAFKKLKEESQLYSIGFLTAYSTDDYEYNICEHLLSDSAYYNPNIILNRNNTYYSVNFTKNESESANFTTYYGIKQGDNASEKINSIYDDLANKIKVLASGTIVDKIPEGFELTDDALAAIQADANAEYDATNRTVTYKNVEAGENTVTKTFEVKYVGDGYGAAYTNVEAKYNATLYTGNTVSKDFPKPVAGLHPKTQPDTDSTSVGTTITVDVRGNDKFEKLTVDGYEVSDYTIVLTDKDGNPTTYDGDFTASMVDGKLQFKSTTAGTKELYYVVKANITKTDDKFAINGKTELASQPTKVTIDVYGTANKAFVVDFGKPVTYTADKVFDENERKESTTIDLTNPSGTYGNMSLNKTNKSITYTLKAFMDGVDEFIFNEQFSDKVTLQKSIFMVPASSIYYEDNFSDGTTDENGNLNTVIKYGAGWDVTGEDKIDSILGDKEYGSDTSYANNLHDSGTVHYVTAGDTAKTAEFEFTGTGIDIYSRVSSETGTVTAEVYNKSGERVARQIINSVSVDGTRYQIPVFTFSKLERDTYTVRITVNAGETYYLDGVRIYSSINENTTVNLDKDKNTTVGDIYNKDNEANAILYHLRNRSLSSMSNVFTLTGKNWITQYENSQGQKVVAHEADVGSRESRVFGPTNEIYLQKGQKVTLTLKDTVQFKSLQLGVKTIEGASKVTINETETTLNSATDMFVKVNGTSRTITIENTGSNIVSLTYLKVVQGK
ncbi:vWA domain-containing protein [Intestinibacter bartlettii]|uniref:VWA domain-containing protein n=1 Tax=Intestinibacter bartlettii TaxID=261299 RepID=A0ABS6E0G3_9FIRM|nr:vWA domain-containing protein [Intestinibacter bartlettii]MBU5337259.1 VWA domain-containing protein [Intestinibacter bartlettii]